MTDNTVYVVTDAEFDGPTPGRNSMMSFACVAVASDGRQLQRFEAVLAPLDGAAPDPGTMAWFATQPDALTAARRDPREPDRVMTDFVAWVRSLPGLAAFVSHPLALDGIWMDFYLRRFAGEQLMAMPRAATPLFPRFALCLCAFAAGRLGWPLERCRFENYPREWLGNVEHSHRALDDAIGYAHLLAWLLDRAAPEDDAMAQVVP